MTHLVTEGKTGSDLVAGRLPLLAVQQITVAIDNPFSGRRLMTHLVTEGKTGSDLVAGRLPLLAVQQITVATDNPFQVVD